MGNHRIQEAVANRLAVISAKLEVSQETVIAEMARLAFSNMMDFIRITSSGEPMIDLSRLTRDQAAALSETQLDDFTEGRGEDARDVRRIKIKLHDKLGALQLALEIGHRVDTDQEA